MGPYRVLRGYCILAVLSELAHHCAGAEQGRSRAQPRADNMVPRYGRVFQDQAWSWTRERGESRHLESSERGGRPARRNSKVVENLSRRTVAQKPQSTQIITELKSRNVKSVQQYLYRPSCVYRMTYILQILHTRTQQPTSTRITAQFTLTHAITHAPQSTLACACEMGHAMRGFGSSLSLLH